MALFVAIARAKSLTKASRVLGIPMASLSRRFAEFEKSLGLRLINRDTRKLELTSIGREYLVECERLIDAASIAHERLRQQKDEPEGWLRLSLTPDFGVLQFSPVLIEFAQKYPLVSFDLNLTSDTIDLIADNIDIAIRFGVPQDSSLTMRSLGNIQHGIYASPIYVAAHGVPSDPGDLPRHTGIRVSHATKTRYDRIHNGGRVEPIQMAERFHSNNLSIIRNFAVAGLGIAIMPATMAREPLATGHLLRILPDWHFEPTPVLALTPSRLLPASSRVFLDFVAAQGDRIFGV